MSEFGDKFGDIARGLLSLEVNTIIKANMTAARMPSNLLDALGQIAADYGAWLTARGMSVPVLTNPVTAASFEGLRAGAVAFRQREGTSAGDSLLAQRIVANSAHLAEIFPLLTGPKPDPDEIVQLRKVWEIGTEQIAFQTVLWIDGDVTHRTLPEYAGENAAPLLAVHSLAVTSAMTMWQNLASVLKSIFESVWSLVKK